jgi:hypothetical protein
VLEVGLEGGGVDRPRIEQVVEDEVPDLAERLEVEGLHEQAVEGFGERAESMPHLVAIGAGVGEETRLGDLPRGAPELAERPHQVAWRHRRHVAHPDAGQDQVEAAHPGVGLGGLHGHAAREVAGRVPLVSELEQHVRGAPTAPEADLTRAAIVLRTAAASRAIVSRSIASRRCRISPRHL